MEAQIILSDTQVEAIVTDALVDSYFMVRNSPYETDLELLKSLRVCIRFFSTQDQWREFKISLNNRGDDD